MRSNKIFYACPENEYPRGGVKQIYRHVDILNENGLEAYVLHLSPGFRIGWFRNETRVCDQNEFECLYDERTDWIAVFEDVGDGFSIYPGRKVIFNQNCYYGFACYKESEPTCYPPLDPQVKAIFTVSEHNKTLLRFALPQVEFHLIVNSVNPDVFVQTSLRLKKRQIAFCGNKTLLQNYTCVHLLRGRAQQGLNGLTDFEWRFIRDAAEEEVARTLSESLVFVFLSAFEGCPLMPMEAVLSGCLVASWNSVPSAAYLPEAYTFPEGDFVSLAAGIERMVDHHLANPGDGPLQEGCDSARMRILEEHTREREVASVLTAWKRILSCERP